MWKIFGFVGVVVVAVALLGAAVRYHVSTNRYYAQMFSEANFREFHADLLRAVAAAQAKGNDQTPATADNTGFTTGAGLTVGVTLRRRDDGRSELHLSMSQPGRVTTHTVCSHFGSFALASLSLPNAEIAPFYTQSGVHHLWVLFDGTAVRTNSFELAHTSYIGASPDIPFVYRPLPVSH